jgi:hypothetical protein
MSRVPNPAEREAAAAVHELRRFINAHQDVDVEQGSEIAANLEAARRAVAAYEEVQSWNRSDPNSSP